LHFTAGAAARESPETALACRTEGQLGYAGSRFIARITSVAKGLKRDSNG